MRNDSATYAGALPGGRDISIQLRRDGFKETVTVPNPRAGASYVDEFDLPAGVTARDAEDGVEFIDEAGAAVGGFGRAFAWDATFPESAASFTPVSVRLLTQSANTASIEVAVDPAWLSAPERSFPVTIDPEFRQATQPGLAGPRDAFIYGAPEYANYGFDHVLDTLWVGNYPRAAGRVDPTRTFMWFDLSSLPTRPAGGYVNWSYLVPYNEGYGQLCTPRAIDVYRLKVPWGADLTWNTQPRDDQVEWFGWGSWKYGSSQSGCPIAGYRAIDTTLLAKMWLSGSPAYTNHGLQLRARDEADPESFKLFVAGDQPATNPNVPYFMVNYITPTLEFDQQTVYTAFENTGTVRGSGYLPSTAYDLYWVNPNASMQLLRTVTSDASGNLPATLVTISNVGQPTSESSTGYVHAFVVGRGTDLLWCVSTAAVSVSTITEPKRGQRVYRVWAPGEADERGRFWTPEDPRTYGREEYRRVAGLPDRLNSGTMLTVGTLDDPAALVAPPRRAARVHPGMGDPPGPSYRDYPGGIIEYEFAPGAAGITIVEQIPLNPPYGGPPPGCTPRPYPERGCEGEATSWPP